MSQVYKGLPKYMHSLQVGALKIATIETLSCGGGILNPVDKSFLPFKVDRDFLSANTPESGDFLVVEPSGKIYCLTAEVFEARFKSKI